MGQLDYATPNLIWPHLIAKVAGSVAIILGTSNLIGWIFYFWVPHHFLPYIILLKPNSALCFILLGVSIWLQCEIRNKITLYCAKICSGIVFIIATLTLFQYFFNINIGIDEALFKEPYIISHGSMAPGRMSPYSASSYVLISFVLLNLNSKVIGYYVHQFLIFIALLISFVELLTTIYSSRFSGIIGEYTHTALPSLFIILTFILVELGTFFIRYNNGISAIITSKNSGGILARKLLPPALLLPIILGYLEVIGRNVGYFEHEVGTSILIMGITLFYLLLVLYNASSINKIDLKRSEAESKLRKNQMQLQGILDNVTAIIYITDLESRFLLVNKEFGKIFHLNINDIIGKKIHDFLPKEYADKFIENNANVTRLREPLSFEEHIPNESEISIYMSNKFPLFNDLGRPYAIGAISTNITELKRIQDKLTISEERVGLALKSAQAGTWSWDIPKDIIIPDLYMRNLLGLKVGSDPGHFDAVLRLVHPDDRQRLDREVREALINGTEFETEFKVIQRDSTIRTIAQRGKIYRDKDGNPLRMTGVCWDITQRKQIEYDLKRSKEIAETLADKAEEANNAKSAFLAAMSHEIRTPLNGVIGMIGLLLDTKLDDEQHECAETIRLSGEALLYVINNILDFSKIESEHMELEQADFDLHTLIHDVIEIMSSQAHRKGLAIGVVIDKRVPNWLVGDSARIRQVLTNIVSNAVKFTDKGEISIKISLIDKVDKLNTIKFEVIDMGVGIASNVFDKLFKPFSQGDQSISRRYGGTGLGLAISKRLVEIMGGTIDVISALDKGATFWFVLQLTESEKPLKSDTHTLLPELKNIKILCVDSNNINREVVKNITEAWGMKCDEASNGGEALLALKQAVANKAPFQLVLVDFHLPDMKGYDFIQLMRELNDISDTSVIILTSFHRTLDIAEIKRLNILSHIYKPISPLKLYQATLIALHKIPGNEHLHKHITNQDEKEKYTNKNANILLAEDNPITLEVTVKILKKLGYKSDTVNNGIEVLSALDKKSYDLILMDCQMPELDGYTATKNIRQQEIKTGKHIPIIAMTAYALKGDREKCIAAGMDDYVSKPIELNILKSVLAQHLNKLPSEHNQIQDQLTKSHEIINDVELKLIDLERLNLIYDNDQTDIKKFLHSYLHATGPLLNEVSTNIKQRNQADLKFLVHKLKGSAGNAGIVKLHVLSKQLEEYIYNAEWNEVEDLFKKCEIIFEKLKEEIKNNYT